MDSYIGRERCAGGKVGPDSYPVTLEAPSSSWNLEDLSDYFVNRRVSVSRELTKKFEETIRGNLTEVIAHFQVNPPRGEFVITIAGDEGAWDPKTQITEEEIREALRTRINSGLTRKAAVQEVATQYRLPKNQVYQLALELE